MPVKNNITGLWRHYKLANMGDSVISGCTEDGSLTGGADATTSTALNKLYLIVNSANTSSTQTVNAEKLLVGTPKTKVVNIGAATDTLDVEGPLLFVSGDQATGQGKKPHLLANDTELHSVYGDASSVAAAMLSNATNFTSSSFMSSYAKSIGINVDENGVKFNIGMTGDPTSLYADFSDPTNSIAPFGYDGIDTINRPSIALSKALRVATFYDFYVTASLNLRKYNSTNTNKFEKIDVGAAVRSMSMNISIDAEQISLLGMGQAPYFAINQVAMEGSMKIVFPLMSSDGVSFPTAVPTWQSVPNPFHKNTTSSGTADSVWAGNRWQYNSDGTFTTTPPTMVAPTGVFPDAPDKLTIDQVTVIPKYMSNDATLFSDTAFGGDIKLSSGIDVVMQSSKVNISTGVLEADMSYRVIFTTSS